MYYFSTYFDINYLPKGLALLESLEKFLGKNFSLFVLALDEEVSIFFERNTFAQVKVIKLQELEAYDHDLLATKSQRKPVEYFFTLSPCLPLYLLEKYPQIDMISQIDADIYFFQSPQVIFDELGDNSILICSHNFSESKKHFEVWGKYNVVFNIFKRTKQGMACLRWWRARCIEWCYDYEENGKFADQKYLEQFPILFEQVVVSQNKGVNVAIFNADNYEFTKKGNDYLVNNIPIVFYHFHRLRKIYKSLYDSGFHTVEDYQSKNLMRIYIYYIKRLQYYERKYKLQTYQPQRFNLILTHKAALKKRVIYDYSIVVSRCYSGIVHLEKYFETYMKLKSLFGLKNGRTH